MTMKEPKISVVIRSRNEERWIGHSIQSVIEHISEPEILIIDNNSDDSTKNIARAFMSDPDRENNGNYADLKIINIEDYSPGKALNLGVKSATGEYVLFLSSHCVLTKFKLEEHISDLETYDAIFGNQVPIWEGKKITKRYLWSHFGDEKLSNMFSEMEGRYFFHNALSFFKRNTLIERPFDEFLVGKEDRYWAGDLIESGGSTLYSPSMEVNHHYTDNGNTWKGVG